MTSCGGEPQASSAGNTGTLGRGDGGGGDDVQPVSGMGEAGGQRKGPRAAGGSRVKELLEVGLVNDMTKAFLPERDVDVI